MKERTKVDESEDGDEKMRKKETRKTKTINMTETKKKTIRARKEA